MSARSSFLMSLLFLGLAPLPVKAQEALTQQVPPAIDRGSYLRVAGPALEGRDGRRVVLHGVNIGGWLVTETWMCGFVNSADTAAASGAGGLWGRSTLESLEQRFGPDQAATLAAAWEDNWITTRDLDRIRDGGFNLVRVPISYRTLQHADGSWILDAQRRIDFDRMDWIVREAAARGIYTIFDLHVWPGQRTDKDRIGRPDGADIRAAMARLWTAIAAHYRGDGAIAAFDLINEFPGAWGVQQVLAKAVHDADPQRLQVVEGFTFPEFMKLHQAGAFPNAIFSDHFYADAPLSADAIAQRLRATANSPVPVYIGEFLAADFPAATRLINQTGASWSSWTYKTVDMGEWGTFNYYPTLRTDIQNDRYEAILAKWSVDLTAWQQPTPQPVNYSTNPNRMANAAPAVGAPPSDRLLQTAQNR